MKLNLPDKIVEAIKSMYHEDRLEYYANFLGFVDFYEGEVPKDLLFSTFGVTLLNLRMAMIWHRPFLEKLSNNELKWLLLHEEFHLISNHVKRGKGYDHKLSNIAQDMIINHLIAKNYGEATPYKYTEPIFTQAEYDELMARGRATPQAAQMIGKSTAVQLDPNYKGDLVYEPLYLWLQQEHQKHKEGKPNKLSQPTKDLLDAFVDGQTVDVHMELDELSDELRQQIVHAASEKCRQRSRYSPDSVNQVLELLLQKPKKDNLKLIKRTIAQVKGFIKNPTYRRPSRKLEGAKGNTKVGKGLTVIWDWSGSMWGEHQAVACELYKDGYYLDVIGSDTEVRKVYKVTSKRELAKVPFSGNGGTELQPAINYVADSKNRLNHKPLVILTDGYTDHLDFSGFNQPVLILTVDRPCPLVVEKDNVRQIVIEK